MKNKICTLLFIIGLMVGCTPIGDQHKTSSLSLSSAVPETSKNEQSISDTPSTNSIDNSEYPLTETGETEVKHLDKNELFVAISEVIAKYNDGTITVSDRIHPLPTDFDFPKDISVENMNVYYSEVMGEHKATISSVNDKWTATFFSNNFIYVDFDGNKSGGNLTVTDVVFMEK